MKRKRFSVEHMVAVLKQAEVGTRVADLIRMVGITEWTFSTVWYTGEASIGNGNRHRELQNTL